MARLPVVNKSTLSITAPNYLALTNAIDELAEAEQSFYEQSAIELSSYTGQSTLSASKVEVDYDTLLGTQPWTYETQVANSNNPNSSPTGAEAYYVLLPEYVGSRTGGALETDDGEYYYFYSPGAGLDNIDLLYTDIDFFSSGFSGTVDIDDSTSIDYQTGFGELPSIFQSNNVFSARIAQTLYVAGTRWNSIVGSTYSNYQNQLNTYNAYVGGGGVVINPGGDPDKPWDGVTGVIGGYNRPGFLSTKLVEETRGYS